MKLTTITNVSLDGVMQGLGGPDEDRSGGFERGGWAIPLFDDEAEAYVGQVFQRADAFLFGRKTYEIFAGYWGVMPDTEDDPIAGPLNARPKYVASTTLTEPEWAGTTGQRPGHRTRPGRLAHHPEGPDRPGVPAGGSAAVRRRCLGLSHT